MTFDLTVSEIRKELARLIADRHEGGLNLWRERRIRELRAAMPMFESNLRG